MKVLAVSNHPGGTAAVIPVLSHLIAQGARCFGLTTALSADQFVNAGIVHDVFSSQVTAEYLKRVFDRVGPDCVVAGTSEPEDTVIGRLESKVVVEAGLN